MRFAFPPYRLLIDYRLGGRRGNYESHQRRAVNSLGGWLGCGLAESCAEGPGRKPGQILANRNSPEIRQFRQIAGDALERMATRRVAPTTTVTEEES
jgi:hypothetical protein